MEIIIMFKTALVIFFACSLLTVVTHVTVIEQSGKSRPLPTVSPVTIRQQLLPELPPVRVDSQIDAQIVKSQMQDNDTTIYQDNDTSINQDNDTYVTLPPAQLQPKRTFRLFLPVVEN